MEERNANNSQEEIVALKKIMRGAGIFTIGVVFSKFITYFTRIFIARYFGPEEYGLFSLGLAVIGFFSAFGVLGLHAGVSRYIPFYMIKNEEPRIRGVLTFSLVAASLVSLIIGGALFLASHQIAVQIFNNPALESMLKVFAVSIPFASLFSILTSAFEGFQKIEYRIYTEKIILNVLKLVFIIFVGVSGYGAFGIAFAYTLATVLTFFAALYFLETRVFSLRSKIQSIYARKELLIFSLPLMAYGFIKTMTAEIDTVMLGYFTSAREVGIYNAAIPTAQILKFVPGTIGVLLLPVMTELYAKGQQEPLVTVYKAVTKWAFYIAFPLLLFMVFFANQIMDLLFGSEYTAGSLALSILAVGFFMSILSFAPSSVMVMIRKSYMILVISVGTILTNVALNLLLIPLYGIAGAALASAVTYTVSATFSLAYIWRIMRISPFSISMVKSIPSGLFSMGVVYFGGKLIFGSFNVYSLLLLIALFLILYTVLLLLLNGLQREDTEILKAIEKKTGIRNEPLRRIIKKFVK